MASTNVKYSFYTRKEVDNTIFMLRLENDRLKSEIDEETQIWIDGINGHLERFAAQEGREPIRLNFLIEIPYVLERRAKIRENQKEVRALEGERERRMKEGVW